MNEHTDPPVTANDLAAGIITAQMAIVSLAHHLGQSDHLKHDLQRMYLRVEKELSLTNAGEPFPVPKDEYPMLFQALERNITRLSEILDYLQTRTPD